MNDLVKLFQDYLLLERNYSTHTKDAYVRDIEEYLKFLQDIPNYIDYAIDYTNEYAE